MQFVGVGVNPFALILVIIHPILYVLYLWGLSRLLAKTRFPRRFVAWAAVLDIVLVITRLQPWFWYKYLLPPIPVSAMVTLMTLAFVDWPPETPANSPPAEDASSPPTP